MPHSGGLYPFLDPQNAFLPRWQKRTMSTFDKNQWPLLNVETVDGGPGLAAETSGAAEAACEQEVL